MIAGTPFVFGDYDKSQAAFDARIQRARCALEEMEKTRSKCNNGTAVCLVCPDGLVVLTLEQDADETIDAWVLLAASTGATGVFRQHEGAMVAIARELGATRLTFRTDRKGWKRLLGPEWSESGDVYSRGVS